MSTAAQTFSRTNMREWSVSMDAFKAQRVNHVFQSSPCAAIFFSQRLLSEAGMVPSGGQGHTVEQGGHALTGRVRLGIHAGAKRGASGWDTHNISPDDNTRLFTSNWAFYTHAAVVSQHDLDINRGEAAWANFLAEQTEDVLLALLEMITDDFYVAVNSNSITPLSTLIGANETSLQSLNPQSHTYYNSRGLQARGTAPASVTFASGSFVNQGLPDMRRAFNNCREGSIKPGVILTEYETEERYEAELTPSQRFQGTQTVGDGSFTALAFKDIPIIPDPKCDSGAMYMVTVGGSDGVHFNVLEGADFDFSPEWKEGGDQTVMVRPIRVTGQVSIKNRLRSNKLTGITD